MPLAQKTDDLPASPQSQAYANAMPTLSSFAEPTTADLLAWSRYMESIAKKCDVTANPRFLNNPYGAIGALSILSEKMSAWLELRLREEERSLLLLERLRHEERQEVAHTTLMATDSDYADEWEGDEDE